MVNKIISFFIRLIYSKDRKIERYLILLILIGFFFRFIAALNLSVLADDMVFASQSTGILNSGLLSTNGNPPLFFYLTDIIHVIFGYTTLAARFWPLLCGTLLIPLVFLITKKFFNKKTALASAFFVTLSNMLIGHTYSEQSLVVLFFCMFGVYLGLEFLDTRKSYFIYLSAIIFGLALLTKYSAPFFIFSFLLFAAYYFKIKERKIFSKKNLNLLISFFIIILLLALPFLTFNYLLYQDKGITDVYFSRVVKTEATQELYGGLLGQEESFLSNLFDITKYRNVTLLFKANILLFFAGLYGLLLLFINRKKHRFAFAFLLLFLIIPFILQSAGSSLEKHFVFIPFFFSISAGFALTSILSKFNKKSTTILIVLLLSLALLINLGTAYGRPPSLFTASPESQLKSFINQNAEEKDIILFDDRIYTARTFWLAAPFHFLPLHSYPDFEKYSRISDLSGLTPIYIVECVTDDCGWGWIKDNPELNSSSEKLLSSLKPNSAIKKSISYKESTGNELLDLFSNQDSQVRYEVYLTYSLLDQNKVKQTDYLSSFYFTPYLYKNKQDYLFDYEIKTDFGNLLHKFSFLILKLAILLAFLSILLFIFFLIKSFSL